MKISYPSTSQLTLSINDFNLGMNTSKDEGLTNMNYATSVENFSFKDGALKNGIGFSDLISELSGASSSLKQDIDAIGSIVRVFHFYKFNSESGKREDKLIFVNHLFMLYYINLYDKEKQLLPLRNIFFTSIPVAVRYRLNGEDVIILSSETDNMVVWNGESEPYTVLDAPKISSMAIHYERLFATVDGEKNAVWFSDDLDPTNWSVSLEEAGFIELIDERGALLKVVSFLDYVYIFREYGISRLTAYGDQTTFAVSNLFVSSGKIDASSVCVCGDRIIFLAEDGLYCFDGVNTNKILSSVERNLTSLGNDKTSSCYYNGYYFLACKFNFSSHEDECLDLFYNNAILCIDISTMKLCSITHGVNVISLSTIEALGGVVALVSDDEKNAFLPTLLCNSASFLANPLKKVWISPKTKLTNGHNKNCLRKIFIETSGEVKLDIFCDGKVKSFTFKGKDRPQAKRVSLPMFEFSFRLTSDDNICSIKNLGFEFIKSKSYF